MTAAGDTSITAFKRYLEGTQSASTANKYSSYAEVFLKLMRDHGYRSFESLPPGLVGDFAAMLSNQGKAASTVRVQVYAVKKYLEWVKGRGVDVPTQAKADLPKVEKRLREILPTDQFTEFFRHADVELDEPTRTAVMLLPCCGLRAEEILSLRLGNIHPARLKMKTSKGKQQRYKDTLYFKVFGKGGKERYVPLMEEGVEILTGYLAGWRRRQKGTWLFPRVSKIASGKQTITTRYLRKCFERVRSPMGIHFTAHTMRRTYITMLWRKGVDLTTLARIAGHANVQTTIDHYIVMDPGETLEKFHDSVTEDN